MKRRGFFGWLAALFAAVRARPEPWSISALVRTPAEDIVPVRVAAMHVTEGEGTFATGTLRRWPNTLAFYDMSAANMTIGGDWLVTVIADCSPSAYEFRKRD